MSTAPLLILAMGNPSRGDDAFGPVMAERIEAWLQGDGRAWQGQLEVICEQQLAVEHVLDLEQRLAVLFIDASASGMPEGGVALTPIVPSANPAVSSHQCPPAVVLGLYQQLRHQAPPPATLLSAPGHGFGLGEALSAPMQAALPQAWVLLQAWLAEPRFSAGACAS